MHRRYARNEAMSSGGALVLRRHEFGRAAAGQPASSRLDGGRRTADGSCAKHREFLVGWASRVLTNLERWLADRDFIAAESFTVADILMALVVSDIKDEGLIAPYPEIASYRDRCLARPAWKRTIEAYCARVEAG